MEDSFCAASREDEAIQVPLQHHFLRRSSVYGTLSDVAYQHVLQCHRVSSVDKTDRALVLVSCRPFPRDSVGLW